jgi:hypothetical protein
VQINNTLHSKQKIYTIKSGVVPFEIPLVLFAVPANQGENEKV